MSEMSSSSAEKRHPSAATGAMEAPVVAPSQTEDKQADYDFTIECPDGSLHAHREKLAAESDYLKGLFAAAMMESESGKVALREISKATMMKILEFINTSAAVDLDKNDALDLLIAGRYLQVTKLIPKCLELVKASISLGSAVELFYTAGEYSISELRESTLDFLKRNIEKLTTTGQFLDEADADLMRTLLESDDLDVPDEDPVYQLLTAWLDRDQSGRREFVDDLRGRIQYPFMKASTVAKLEEALGPIGALSEITTSGFRNLEEHTSSLRRRRYNAIHCHFLWQQRCESEFTFPRSTCRLVQTCNVLGQSQSVLTEGVWELMPLLSNVTTNEHTMYSAANHNLYYFSRRTEPDFQSLRPTKVLDDPLYPADRVVEIGANDGALYVLTNRHSPVIHKLNLATGSIERQEMLDQSTATAPPWSDHVSFIGGSDYLVDLVTGRQEMLDQTKFWVHAIQRGDTMYLWHFLLQTGLDNVTTLNLSNGQWGADVHTHWVIGRGTHLTLIHGDVYMLHLTEEDSPPSITEVDEGSRLLREVKMSGLPRAGFVGIAPVDIGPPCSRETWLSAQIRKLPDETQAQRALIEKLRRISHD